MVVSVSRPATEAGVAVLRDGGNAVDAAVTVALALQVTWPEAGNIGGGGFMLLHPKPGESPVCIEYRETAPAAAHALTFDLKETTHSSRVAGVPGTLRGLQLAHSRYGRLPWSRLVAPAIELARQGFEIDASLATSLNKVLKAAGPEYAELHRVYGKPDGHSWQAGDRLLQPDLARTLQRIAEQGPEDFYTGAIARQIVAEMQSSHGLMTQQDLAGYLAQVREPVRIPFRDVEIYAPPLPSSGGLCLAEMFPIWEELHLDEHDHGSLSSVHLKVETMRRVFLDRARYFGDPDFATPPADLLDRDRLRTLAHSISPDHATPSRDLAPDLDIVDGGTSTTHFSIVDSAGMAVSNTYTLEQSFGSWVVVRGAGFLLNNEMGDFNWKPGLTTTTGRIGTAPNLVAPGKRMLSSQSPVLVLRDGQTVLVTGSPGGRTIINTVALVLCSVLVEGLPLQQAIAEPRFHHQWLPDQIVVEQSLQATQPELIENLRRMGHHVVVTKAQGDAHSIARDPASGRVEGVADQRRRGFAQAE
jgi:gamma-glutamyltranspeptidase/glutathione hydrolase